MSTPSVLTLPAELALGSCLSDASALVWVIPSATEEVTVRCEEPITHIEPLPLAMLAAWADLLLSKGVRVRVDDSVKSEYTWKFGLLSSLAGRPPPPAINDSRYLPPTAIRSDEDRQRLLSQVAPILNVTDDAQRNALRECLSEILRNVAEHADSERGAFVCASYFPGADRVSIAVVDTGVGVPTTIRRKHGPELSDADALDAALTYGVTGSRAFKPFGGSAGTVDNAGIGLYMVRSAATLSGGVLALVSGRAFARSDRLEDVSLGDATHPWRGTAVAVSFRPSQAQAAWKRRLDLLPKADRKREVVGWGPGPTGCATIAIRPTVGQLAEDKDSARRVRDELLLPEIRAKRAVCIDLREPRVVTHTFVHALLYEVVGEAGEDSARLIHVYAKERQIKDIVRMVSRYAYDDALGARTEAPDEETHET